MTPAAAELPPYRALLAVDIRDFSGVLAKDHARITDAIPTILCSAFQRCGLSEIWHRQRFGFGTGDGYALGLPSTMLPFLLNPFLAALQEELVYRSEVHADPVPLRMRVSVHIGPVTDSGADLLSEGSGTARIETHRLLDAGPVRELLNRSGPMTRVAAIVSEQAYHDAVLSGYAADAPEHYVPAPVEVKKHRGIGYLRVPSPSGDLLRDGFLPRVSDPADTGAVAHDQQNGEATSTGSGPQNTVNTHGGPGFLHGGTGDQNYHAPAPRDDHHRP
ncbi:hypothetical protein [Amycolatopsis sp. WQ 127309]|uniref:hypothetical protein n=1 Tax=Amycolatopsis sp. WQ 127309 TaxID=2932773 RepID=UPI001FF67C07|nr:hypothetical protein [Amycolatopsis sp. WQ 127309]UOZ02529.1 hypothetical protein MUY22_27045 [Amycolatopsis sp. WQ 127309]